MKYCLILFVFTLLFACAKDKPLPIEEDLLIKVLCDVHVAETTLKQINSKKKDSLATRLYSQIYEIHHVKQADLDTALFYLKKNPKEMERIYSKVVEELGKMKMKDE